MLNSVNPYAANLSACTTSQNSKRLSTASDSQGENKANPAVINNISEEAKKIALELKEYGADSPLKLDEAFLNPEARAQRKADFAKSLSGAVTLDPLDNDFQIAAITTHTFSDGTLEKFIADSLDGKVKNAVVAATELGKMIRGTIHNPGASIEERAANREIALKHAAYIAENYFDTPGEAKAFLDEINRFAQNDIMREKGYIVMDNSDIPPFKSYESSVRQNGGISWDAYAKQAGFSNAREIFEDKETLNSFYTSLSGNSKTWDAQIIQRFDENEKKVADIISMIKASLNETDVANSLQRFLKVL